jgi:hypothetical protein
LGKSLLKLEYYTNSLIGQKALYRKHAKKHYLCDIIGLAQ